MGNTKRGHVLFSLMICLGLVLSLGMGATGTEMTVLFEDDFSTGATKWEILQDDGDTVKPGPNNEYLLMADFENTVHMRVPDLVTNRFDLVVDLDLSTGALDWFGVHFGTTNENAFGPGHIVMIRPNGRVQLWRAPGGGSWKSGSSITHLTDTPQRRMSLR